jgi:hypothetical protein
MMKSINETEAKSCSSELISRIALDGLRLEDWLA